MDIENTLASRYPELAKEWHPSKNGNLTPYDVSYGSGKRVWWLGKCGHDWDAKITNRVYGNQYNVLAMLEAEQDVDHLLREDERKLALPVQKPPTRPQPEPRKKLPNRDYER